MKYLAALRPKDQLVPIANTMIQREQGIFAILAIIRPMSRLVHRNCIHIIQHPARGCPWLSTVPRFETMNSAPGGPKWSPIQDLFDTWKVKKRRQRKMSGRDWRPLKQSGRTKENGIFCCCCWTRRKEVSIERLDAEGDKLERLSRLDYWVLRAVKRCNLSQQFGNFRL